MLAHTVRFAATRRMALAARPLSGAASSIVVDDPYTGKTYCEVGIESAAGASAVSAQPRLVLDCTSQTELRNT